MIQISVRMSSQAVDGLSGTDRFRRVGNVGRRSIIVVGEISFYFAARNALRVESVRPYGRHLLPAGHKFRAI